MGATASAIDSSPPTTIVTLPDIPVMYVTGDKEQPIAQQAPAAFRTLEAKLPSLNRRKFYGVNLGGEYRACVSIEGTDDLNALPHAQWTIPGGRYARRRIPNWGANIRLIGPSFEELRTRPDSDPTRPSIEYYRSQRELLVMVPVR